VSGNRSCLTNNLPVTSGWSCIGIFSAVSRKEDSRLSARTLRLPPQHRFSRKVPLRKTSAYHESYGEKSAGLTELPAVVDAASRHLERPVEQIEFRLDTPTPSEPVPLTQLSVSPTEVIAISEVLMGLGLRADRIKAR